MTCTFSFHHMNRTCVDSCPATGYYVSSELQCLSCHASCSNCIGPEQYQCLSCAPTFYQIIDKNLCVDRCLDGYHLGKIYFIFII